MIPPVRREIDWDLWKQNATRMDHEMWKPCLCPPGACPSVAKPRGFTLYMGHHRHSAWVKLDEFGRITFVHGKGWRPGFYAGPQRTIIPIEDDDSILRT